MKLEPGMLLWVALGRRIPPGHEQAGERPALLVGVPAKVGRPRFPMLLVAPVTTYGGQMWAQSSPQLYPLLPSGTARLPRDSIVLLDQLQAIDSLRVLRLIGELSEAEYSPVKQSLASLLALP